MSSAPGTHRAHIVFPNQLFQETLALDASTHLFLTEDAHFFEGGRRFHKQKLVLHRASMRAFAEAAQKRGYTVTYCDAQQAPDADGLAARMRAARVRHATVFDPTDTRLTPALVAAFKKHEIELTVLESPNFLLASGDARALLGAGETHRMQHFYAAVRRRFSILMDSRGKPLGGRMSFDTENRKRLPAGLTIPKRVAFRKTPVVLEAIAYVNTHFPDNPGRAEDFAYPIDRAGARRVLADFIEHRLARFGPYEDAISRDERVLFHSMLSAPLNVGLLSPREVLDAVLGAPRVPIASREGFVRQLIGWREFMRAVYLVHGTQMRRANVLKHNKHLPVSWYTGTVGIAPIDATIAGVLATAYAHHIERLMILGSPQLLMGIRPADVYGWFMDLFIDAYDWVMVPNVFGMSQFAAGDLMTTKPYFSGSNYIRAMSDYPRGEWCDVWDGLLYAFLDRHRALIGKNPRLGVLIKNLDALTDERRHRLAASAKPYL
ncbi:cryptochrome/photolyase family protein [Patescibacteria group bacterium]|nr:cryptochrome/photolyase family protein [Patescibacteria group bacterium]